LDGVFPRVCELLLCRKRRSIRLWVIKVCTLVGIAPRRLEVLSILFLDL
jgi:hypothetical protein